MANQLFDSYRNLQLEGTSPVQYLADDIVLILLDVTYVFDPAHETIDDLSGVVATSDPFTGKTAVAGVADADDVLFPLLTGAEVTQMILAMDSGTPSTSPLMVYLDTRTDFAPISIIPSGVDETVVWSGSTTRIFRL